ncbi:MAG: amidase [Pseudorhodoplanes sp.]|uniref:amidase n=1 Tax=Pseudorhodoplanes sp. TaxID=1934341 RepID=UPI003D0F070F
MSEPFELTACDAVSLIKSRKLSAVELIQSCLKRINALEPDIGAWTVISPENALAQARAFDAAPTDGAMAGLPIAVKDVIDTVDFPTEYGCPAIFKDFRPRSDAACVALARNAGAIVMGKTVTQSLACGAPVPTANPLNLDHTTGGSSSGSVAAVAAKMVPVAFGTQSASSTIRPSSYTGLVGMRPSMGLISVAGFKYFNGSFDTIGLIARDVDDVELLWSVQVGAAFQRGQTPSWPPRIGVCFPPWLQPEQDGTRRALIKACDSAVVAGGNVHEVSLPSEYADLVRDHEKIQAFETAKSYADEALNHWDKLDARVQALVQEGRSLGLDRYLALIKRARQMRAHFDEIISGYDFILTTAAPGEAPKGYRALGHAFTDMGDTSHSRAWTLLHVPSITIPCAKGPTGLPIGVQLIGPRGSDQSLMHNARRLLETYSV